MPHKERLRLLSTSSSDLLLMSPDSLTLLVVQDANQEELVALHEVLLDWTCARVMAALVGSPCGEFASL